MPHRVLIRRWAARSPRTAGRLHTHPPRPPRPPWSSQRGAAPTSTVSSGPTSCLVIVPSAGAGTSASTLSVETSTTVSPSATEPPFLRRATRARCPRSRTRPSRASRSARSRRSALQPQQPRPLHRRRSRGTWVPLRMRMQAPRRSRRARRCSPNQHPKRRPRPPRPPLRRSGRSRPGACRPRSSRRAARGSSRPCPTRGRGPRRRPCRSRPRPCSAPPRPRPPRPRATPAPFPR